MSAINAAILVLRGKPASLPFSIGDRKEDLFLLAHFLGDLHQPLHVGAVYLTTQGLLVNPDQGGPADPATETAGGNFINDQGHNIHAEWDAIPADIGDSAGSELIDKARAVAPTNGQIDDFAAAWATDTVRAAQAAFAGATFTAAADPQRWDVHFQDRTAYWSDQNLRKRDQLARSRRTRSAGRVFATTMRSAPRSHSASARTTNGTFPICSTSDGVRPMSSALEIRFRSCSMAAV